MTYLNDYFNDQTYKKKHEMGRLFGASCASQMSSEPAAKKVAPVDHSDWWAYASSTWPVPTVVRGEAAAREAAEKIAHGEAGVVAHVFKLNVMGTVVMPRVLTMTGALAPAPERKRRKSKKLGRPSKKVIATRVRRTMSATAAN